MINTVQNKKRNRDEEQKMEQDFETFQSHKMQRRRVEITRFKAARNEAEIDDEAFV